MFGMGMPEIILILAIALIVIGPKKLPDLAKSLGRAMGEFKRATTEFKESVDFESNLTSVRNSLNDTGQDSQADTVLSSKGAASDADEPEKTGSSGSRSESESEPESALSSETSPDDSDDGKKIPESDQTDKQAEKSETSSNRE